MTRFAAALVTATALCSGGCIYARMFYFNTPSLNAASYFDERAVAASPTPTPLERAQSEATPPLTDAERTTYGSFDALLEKNDTRAFVALRDDRVVYERYFGGVTAQTRLPSFSVSKTFTALLVGVALRDGLLDSLDAPLVRYVPALSKKRHYGEITLEEMLRMTSGIAFDEESTSAAKLFYCTNIEQRIYQYPVKWTPGEHYEYGSVSIQLLWDVLHTRLAGKSISKYFEERIWRPLGAERSAAWALDSAQTGVEKLFGGFSATARDHARLGLLYLHGGSFHGQTIVSPRWVDESIAPDPVAGVVHTADGEVRRGKYQWFLTKDGRAYFAKGFHGQYVFVVPDRKMVFVRFGEGYGDVNWPELFVRFADEAQ